LLYCFDLGNWTRVLLFCFCSLLSLLFECIDVFRLIFFTKGNRICFLRCVRFTSLLLFSAVKASKISYHIIFSFFRAGGWLSRCLSFLKFGRNSGRVNLVTIWSLRFIFLRTLIGVRLFFWRNSAFLRWTILLNFSIFLIINRVSIFLLGRAYEFPLYLRASFSIVNFVLISKHISILILFKISNFV
jgi:hypothetical protein